jgi:hypothetical protein
MEFDKDGFKIDKNGNKYRDVTIQGLFWDTKYRYYPDMCGRGEPGVMGSGNTWQDKNDKNKEDLLLRY